MKKKMLLLLALIFAIAAFSKIQDDPLKKYSIEYDQLKAKYASSPFSYSHLAVHLFGEKLYERAGIDGVTVCDSDFGYACFHGFFSRAISENGPSIVKELDATCMKRFGKNNEKLWPCRHGLGHGLVEYMGHDRSKLTAALDACPKNGNTSDYNLFGCPTGVIMEYNAPIVINENKTSAYSSLRSLDNDPNEPCVSIPEKYRDACFRQMPQLWERYFDYIKMGTLCNSEPALPYSKSCFRGIGTIVGSASNYDPKLTIARCEKMPTRDGIVFCKQAASASILSQTGNRANANTICNGLSVKEKERCAK